MIHRSSIMYKHAGVSFFLLLLSWTRSSATGQSIQQSKAEPVSVSSTLAGKSDSPEIYSVYNGNIVEKVQTYMASVRTLSGTHGCGGSLIHPHIVLTAAHCIEDDFKPDVDVARLSRVGRSGSAESFKTVEVIVHKDYDPESFDYDIALLVLDKASKFEPLPLEESSDACFEEQGGCPVQILGWGTTERGFFSSVLLEGYTRSVSRKICEELIGSSSIITERMLCAGDLEGGKSDTCQGDSGGPMILYGRQVGIVSFGLGCAQAQRPGVYTSVPELYPWIQSKISDVVEKCECAENGISGGASTRRLGCKAHLESDGDSGRFCMVIGGSSCPYAYASKEFPGAAWIDC